ncbi:MAG TPA: hypothetical protein VGS58_15775 [Candidatus Sulfopaludibacter sp.]|nr:hypothetical protein [Candidatus Sulfopaludibacter sp.]
MRTALPNLRPNGHAAPPAPVFAISGMCQQPSFRLRLHASGADDFCLIYLGASQFGSSSTEDPYFILRRSFDGGAAVAALRVDWEGVFTLLANDEDQAEAVFHEMIEPCGPEEVQRQWSDDPSAQRLFAEMLQVR